MNIFCAKLSAGTTGDDLEAIFSKFGEVTSAKVIRDRDTGMSKKFGFVEMESEADGIEAIENLDGSVFDGSEIVVKKAQPRENRGGGSNRYGQSGGRDYGNRRRY